MRPGAGRLVCGLDLGASAAKLVLLDQALTVRARVVRHSGLDYAATARACLEEALASVDGAVVARTVATGYGRRNVPFADATATEILCQGAGCRHLFPSVTTIVDIGGQDNKVIRLDADGRRVSFKMNRKCAAGTGAFVEEIALRLGLDVSDMEPLAAAAPQAVRLSSFCTVFAKTEILTHLRAGVPAGAIVRGAFESVVQRVTEMDPLNGEVVLTGGVVAHNPTVAAILAAHLGRPVRVPEHAQLTGALGAALTAAQQLSSVPPPGGDNQDVEAANA